MKITNNKKSTILALFAVATAFLGEYSVMAILGYVTVFEASFNNNVFMPVAGWFLTYGLMFVFGLICYGKDKRLLRFPLAYAFGNAVFMTLWSLGKVATDILNFSIADETVDPSVFSAVIFVISAATMLVTLLKSIKPEDLFCKPPMVEQDSAIPSASVRNRLIYGDKAYAIITAIVFGIGFFVVRVGTISGYYLAVNTSFISDSTEAVSFRADIVDAVIRIAELAVCYLISRGFCENKKEAFYFLKFYLFAVGMSSVFDGIARYFFLMFVEALNVSEAFINNSFYYIPTSFGDIAAIIISVFMIKRLISKRR